MVVMFLGCCLRLSKDVYIFQILLGDFMTPWFLAASVASLVKICQIQT